MPEHLRRTRRKRSPRFKRFTSSEAGLKAQDPMEVQVLSSALSRVSGVGVVFGPKNGVQLTRVHPLHDLFDLAIVSTVVRVEGWSSAPICAHEDRDLGG